MPPRKKRGVPPKKTRGVAPKKGTRVASKKVLTLGQKLPSGAPKPIIFRHTFEKGEENVNRKVTIEIPPQGTPGVVKVIAAPLPHNPPTVIPAPKGGGNLITLVINPQVTIGTNEVYDFKPALRITIYFTEDDLKGAQRDPITHQPQLRIVTLYDAKKGEGLADWRWEKLETAQDFKRGTLTARISTLHPNDPIGEGTP